MRSIKSFLRWVAVAAIILGWYLFPVAADSHALRSVLLIVAFVASYGLIRWEPPIHGVFRERRTTARARKVFVAAEPSSRDPFVVRRRYRVRKAVAGRPGTTVREGELLCYIGRAYLSYERMMSFSFLNEEGETVFIALRDNESVAVCREMLDEVDESRVRQHA